MDPAQIQSLITQLAVAIGTGVKSVYSNGQRIEYQSIDDMITARNDLQAQLDKLNGASARRRRWANYRYVPVRRIN